MLHYAGLRFSIHPAGLFSHTLMDPILTFVLDENLLKLFFCFKYLMSDMCLLDLTVEK